MASSSQYGGRSKIIRLKFWDRKEGSDQTVTIENNDASDVSRKPSEWSDTFESDPHHHDFIRKSAESIQEAMNIAAAENDVNGLLNVAERWGHLAEFTHNIRKNAAKHIGFVSNKEEGQNGRVE